MAPLRALLCSCQRGESRYSSKEDGTVPEVAQYRNNLTAMSQYENLLFVAYLDKIHIFRPDFPLQTLSKIPELVIDLPKSRPGRRGYLDLASPHAVNHLIVGDMGNGEILVAACDDGDVISYTLRSINLAIERSRADDSQPRQLYAVVDCPTSLDGIPSQSVSPAAKPWFLENVGHSAWGLAVHKEARLLAVSSNTQIIDVFAPALSDPGHQESDVAWSNDRNHMTEDCKGGEKWKISVCYSPSDRVSNLRIRLYGHTTNIPNITFADVDPHGRYLASTDIDGYTFVWDIYSGCTIFESRNSTLQSTRGWAVACLDPLTSRLTRCAEQTFGCDGHTDDKNTVIDISEGCHSIPDNSHWHPGFAKYGAVPGANPLDILAMLPQHPVAEVDSDELSSDADEETLEEDLELDDQADLEAESEAMDTDADQEEVPTLHGPLEHSATENGEEMLIENLVALETAINSQPNNADLPVTIEQNHWLMPTSPPGNEQKSNIRRSRYENTAIREPSEVQLPFNLLQASESDICLFRDIRYDASTREPAHTRVISQQALHQKMPPALRQIERLNMITQIPELGIIVIGNQVGRVGILTATRWQASQQSGYRVDCILPFKSQEEQGIRPQKALMGMAVGPLQGHEYSPDPSSTRGTSQEKGATTRPISWGSSRRFRLLMVYCDHTVLSYEISRQSNDEILVV